MFPFLYSELQADFCPAGFFVKVAPVPCSVNANPSLRPKPTQAHSELCLAWSALVPGMQTFSEKALSPVQGGSD